MQVYLFRCIFTVLSDGLMYISFKFSEYGIFLIASVLCAMYWSCMCHTSIERHKWRHKLVNINHIYVQDMISIWQILTIKLETYIIWICRRKVSGEEVLFASRLHPREIRWSSAKCSAIFVLSDYKMLQKDK